MVAVIKPLLDAGIRVGQAEVLELYVLGNSARGLDPAGMSETQEPAFGTHQR